MIGVLVAVINAAYCDRIWGEGGWVYHPDCSVNGSHPQPTWHHVQFHDAGAIGMSVVKRP